MSVLDEIFAKVKEVESVLHADLDQAVPAEEALQAKFVAARSAIAEVVSAFENALASKPSEPATPAAETETPAEDVTEASEETATPEAPTAPAETETPAEDASEGDEEPAAPEAPTTPAVDPGAGVQTSSDVPTV